VKHFSSVILYPSIYQLP